MSNLKQMKCSGINRGLLAFILNLMFFPFISSKVGYNFSHLIVSGVKPYLQFILPGYFFNVHGVEHGEKLLDRAF